jgi:hypothetical protein
MTTIINATTSGLIESVDTSGILEIQVEGQSALIIGTDQNANFTSTGAVTIPVGTTAQRPTPTNGMLRYNNSSAVFETYANNSWGVVTLVYPPVNTVAPVISGTPAINQTLTSTTGTWANTPTGYYYQWLANSVAITSNASSNTFVLTDTQVGANITCNVTAYNLAGNSSPTTSNSLGPVLSTYDIQYFAVAGGGGGGNSYSGGGGAGGYLANSVAITPGAVLTVTLGGGGTNGSGNGSNTTITSGGGFSNIACQGGGGGGNQSNPGKAGGSSGGGAAGNTYGTATSGQGNRGGAGGNASSGGGGGGAAGVGSNGNNGSYPDAPGGSGGPGIANPITGSTAGALSGGIYYVAGGGSGGGGFGSGANVGGGGSGGGGSGGSGSGNTGGGGGGDNGVNDPRVGGSGGSGVVVFSMPTSRYSGTYSGASVVITTSGSNTIVTFNSSGTYTA